MWQGHDYFVLVLTFLKVAGSYRMQGLHAHAMLGSIGAR
jgi:hypothetical protein